ncbi:hypothetical protein [Aeromicrobium sp.]|uniref:hypothetical protein n=1 Tax=Aeromicrobium sp. TaxID=1871063 RepID=UPI002FC91725
MSTRMVKVGPERSTVILGIIVAALVVALAFVLLRGGDDDSSAGSEALEAATTAAVDLTTYDHTHLDRDFAWVKDGATSSFAKEYAATNEPLRDIITKLKADAVGTVVEASATVEDFEHVTVLLFVDQTITNGTDAKTRTERNRVVMSMVKRGGAWLVDDVELR